MNEQDAIYKKVIILLEKGALPLSSCSKALLDFLRPSIEAGVVVEKRSNSGRCLAVQNSGRLRQRLESCYPNVVLNNVPSRVAGVARYRDSKVLQGDTPDVLTLRSWSETALTYGGEPLPTSALTTRYGVFSFMLRNESEYRLRGPWALVEGPVLLLHFERLRHECHAVLYGNGRLSGRVLSWLASQTESDFRLVHFPDYDPVGLSEFVRLRRALGARADLYLPPGLDERFAHFSKRSLLYSPASQRVLRGVRSSRIPEVRLVMELIHKNNAGLEQEQLLIERALG